MNEDKFIANELEKTGIYISDIYDLVNSNRQYTDAIPTLLNLLNLVKDKKNKEGIIRALAVKQAKKLANSQLLKMYFEIPNDQQMLKWVIGNTIEVIVTNEDVDSILRIVKDKTNGFSRQMFVLALAKIRTEKVESTLIELLSDDKLALHAVTALTKHKSKKAIPHLLPMLNHQKKAIKKAAEKSLKKLEVSR